MTDEPRWKSQVRQTAALIENAIKDLEAEAPPRRVDGKIGPSDSAAVCLNGHVIAPNLMFVSPHSGVGGTADPFCQECGAKVVYECTECGTPIRGGNLDPEVDYEPPKFCYHCGTPFPWTKSALDAIAELAADAEELEQSEREQLVKASEEMAANGPGAPAAASRFAKLAGKIGGGVGKALLDVGAKVAAEAALQYLGMK